jgi:hypothetical protein
MRLSYVEYILKIERELILMVVRAILKAVQILTIKAILFVNIEYFNYNFQEAIH